MCRNMTQRALAKATDGVSESALRSYELGSAVRSRMRSNR